MRPYLPQLGMDGVLCDRPQPGCVVGGKRIYARDNISNLKMEITKMKTISTSDASTYGSLFVKNRAVASRFLAKCMGQDAAMDDETVEKLKGFLKSRLSAEDHEQVCNMLEGDVEAQDDKEEGGPLNKVNGELPRAAADAQADFSRRYPGLAGIRQDTSGIQPPPRRRASSVAMDAAGTKSFAERYPGLAHIRQA